MGYFDGFAVTFEASASSERVTNPVPDRKRPKPPATTAATC